MTAATVSVVIVSRNRPAALARCLTAVAQLDHPAFEIVVVADGDAVAGLDPRWQGRIKTAVCDQANISVARNIGIGLAAGDIIAFIDDDAVPEPMWLGHLAAPFADAGVAAAGGLVRGRNGISVQWSGRTVDAAARTRPLPATAGPLAVAQRQGHALKTEGTNMAFRRGVLLALGGFDPAFRFYLDETDVNLRLAATGATAVFVPLAEVHHGFAASERRRADRVPLDLHEVGASLAVFLRRHAGGADPARLAEETAARRLALIDHMVAGRIEPRDVDRLLGTLAQGWDEGLRRPAPAPDLALGDRPGFLPFSAGMPGHHRVIGGPSRRAAALRAEAARAVAAGERVSLYLFSVSARHHRAGFSAAGYWWQSGGLFGRSDRSDPPFRFWRHNDRLSREVARTAGCRMRP